MTHLTLAKRPQPPAMYEPAPKPKPTKTMAEIAAEERAATRRLFGATGWQDRGGPQRRGGMQSEGAHQIIDLLRKRPMSNQELADATGKLKTTVRNHIGQIRRAGYIVTIPQPGGKYELHEEKPCDK